MKRAVLVVVIGVLLSGCYTMSTAKRNSLVADISSARRAVDQSAVELRKVLKGKDHDIRKFAPSYARERGLGPEDVAATLESSDRVSSLASGFILDLVRARDILQEVEDNLEPR